MTRKNVNVRNLLLIGLTVVTASLVLTACSSTSTKSTKSPVSSKQASSVSTCVSKAKALVAHYEVDPPMKFASAINVSSLRGKTVWMINEDESVPVLAGIEKGVDEAGAAAGIHVVNYNGAGTVTGAAEGISEAVGAHASAIIIDAIQASLVESELKAAESAHIPVISDYEPPDIPGTIFATVNTSGKDFGGSMAAEALVATGCHLNAAFDYTTIFSAQIAALDQGVKPVLNGLCPACALSEIKYDEATVPTSAAPQAVEFVEGHPNVNVLLAATDDIAEFIVPALQQIHSKVLVCGSSAVPVDLGYVRQGKQLCDVADASNQYTGWASMDQVFRALLGKAPSTDDNIPMRLITKANIPVSNNDLLPNFNGYQAGFKKTWGLIK